jgi:hypothetical protein
MQSFAISIWDEKNIASMQQFYFPFVFVINLILFIMKKNMIFRNLALIFLLSAVTTCALPSTPQTNERNLSNFQKISFNISGNLYLTQGDAYVVKLEGKEADLAEIITKVENNTLLIKSKSGWKQLGDIKIYVTMPVIEGADLAGSGNIYATQAIKAESITLSVSGSGNITFENLVSANTHASIAGSGNIQLKGKSAESLDIDISGSGNVSAENFETKNTGVNISGSGSARVYATENLKTDIVGSGSVFYKGRPLINANSVGSGSTRPL